MLTLLAVLLVIYGNQGLYLDVARLRFLKMAELMQQAGQLPQMKR